jgi:hypothetical protein
MINHLEFKGKAPTDMALLKCPEQVLQVFFVAEHL